jgi:hypothetical protein
MYESYSMGSHILKGAMYLIRRNELVEYLPFGTFVKTFTENCNGIRIWKYDLVNMMWWMYVCDILFYENVVLWNHTSIAPQRDKFCYDKS